MCSNMHGQSTDELFDALSELFAKYTLIAGCSNPFEDFENMMYCYQEALFTLNRIESLQNPQPINYFRDHTLEHILKYGTSIIPAHLLCAGCIMDLAKRDKDAQVSYCDSLRIYLDCGMNMMETARLLNIKRNTFLARLERIMRFIDLDLDDADDRLYLQISLRMIRHS